MKIIGIYKITNPKGKVYIGQSVDIHGRWHHYELGHGKNQVLLINSIKKYGFDKHKFEILTQCQRSELNNLEKYYVDMFQSFNSRHGLNLKDGGGQQGEFSDETKSRMSISHIGLKPSLKTKRKRSTSVKKYMKEHPHKHSDQWKKDTSERMMGSNNHFFNKSHSLETIEKMRASAKNRKKRIQSIETRLKISKSHKLRYEKRQGVSNMQ